MKTPTLKAKDPAFVKPEKSKILVYGPAGIGKTWVALDFPGVYYIDTEGGATEPHYIRKLKAAGGVYMGPAEGSTDFKTVVDEIIALATTKHPYKTVVIDSLSKIANIEIDMEYERMQRSARDMSKTYGAEKKPALAWTRRIIRWLDRLDMNAVIICHQKKAWEKGEEVGVTYDAYDKMSYELNLALQIEMHGDTRRARVIKSRIETFKLNAVFDWSYPKFAEMFGRDAIESDVTSITIATPDQVKRVQDLLEIVKIDPETIDKWFKKAKVEGFDEMDNDTITKCINYLANIIKEQP